MKPEELTAWALNELDAGARSRLEEELGRDAAARHSAEHTRQFCDFLTQELRDDALGLTDAQLARLRGLPLAPAAVARTRPARQRSVSWHRLLRPAVVAAAVLAFLGLAGYLALPRSWRHQPAQDPRFTMKPGGPEARPASVKPGLPAPAAPQARPRSGWRPQDGHAMAGLPPPPSPQVSRAMTPPSGLLRPDHGLMGIAQPPATLSGRFAGFTPAGREPHASITLERSADPLGAVRGHLMAGRLPPPEAVRLDELLMAFPIPFASPLNASSPLVLWAQTTFCPWQPRHHLLVIHVIAGKAEQGGPPPPVVKDVHAQVRFNPGWVYAYRRVGEDGGAPTPADSWEPQAQREGAVISAGEDVVAVYELVPAGLADEEAPLPGDKVAVQPALQLASPPPAGTAPRDTGAIPAVTVRVEYQATAGGPPGSTFTWPSASPAPLDRANPELKLRAALAGFGLLLRGGPDAGSLTWEQVHKLAVEGAKVDPSGDRAELVRLIEKARALVGK